MKNFIGRKQELQVLNDTYDNKDALVLLTGIHHIGKTGLIQRFAQGKPLLYFSANEVADNINRKSFLTLINHYFGKSVIVSPKTPDWEELFKSYAQQKESSRKVLVLDNVDHLIQSNPDFNKILIQSWQKYLKPNNVMLILTLSNSSILKSMENKKNPIMSAASIKIRLQPISFLELLRDNPESSFEELVSKYAIAGGTPKYLNYLSDADTIYEQLRLSGMRMLNPASEFYNLPIHLLEKDLWDPVTYSSILSYIAMGYEAFNELQVLTDLNSRDLLKHLDNLQVLGFIKPVKSVLDRKLKAKKARYTFDNEAMRYWYTFIYPNRSLLESGREDLVFKQLKKEYPMFLKKAFRDISQEMFLAGIRQQALDFNVDMIGPFFSKSKEIPLIAIDKKNKQIIYADTTVLSDTYSLENFKQFIDSVKLNREFRRYKDYKTIYALFTGDVLDERIKEYALDNDNIYVFSGTKIFKKD